MFVLRRVMLGSERRENIHNYYLSISKAEFCLAAVQPAVTARDNNPWHSRTENFKKELILEIN